MDDLIPNILRFVGCDEANAMLRYDYRPGFSL